MNFTDEQLQAINKSGTNIIVSAGAGSGKTAVLSERVLRILKEGVHIDELLILTFTNAAASEMKERIRKKIKRDESLIDELDLIDSSYITTFDSFALSILKKYHYLLNISPNVSIADESLINIKRNEYLDEIFDEYYSVRNSKFIKLITTFCNKDDKEIKRAIIDINNKLDLIVDKEKYLNNYINAYFNDTKINDDIKEYENLLLTKVEKIGGLINELSLYTDNSYIEKMKESLDILINSKTYDEIKNSLDIKLPIVPKNSIDIVKSIKESISSIIKELKESTIDSIEDIKNNILSTKEYVEVIIEIINKLDNKLSEFKFKNDIYTFNDIAHLSIKIVKENEEIRNELKNKFSEILIDEYQDTSDIQEEFISLISNKNVYMVGDIKQSIYRFRNANPDIFKNKYDLYSSNKDGIKIDLNKNFRSREEVLDNINLIFNQVMTDIKGGANYKQSHNMIFGNNSYNNEGKTNQNNNMEILKYGDNKLYKKEEIEAFIICNDIEEKINNKYQIFDKDKKVLRDITYSDFVILMDRTTDFDTYKEIFTYKNIPLIQIKDSKMNDEVDLYIIKNIIKLVLKENNIDTEYKYLFMSIARSFLFNMNDNDIYNTITNGSYNDNIIIKKINNLLADIDNSTPKIFIDKILKEFDYYERLLTITNIESSLIRLEKIKEFVSNLELLGYNIEDFSNYLEDLLDSNFDLKYSVNDNSEGVKIMTIHKSKGLEYHICYYSGLYKLFNISDLKEKFTYSKDYGIITPYFKEGIGSTIYKTMMKNKYLIEEESEKLRLFYVALTRAKEKMILIEPNNIKPIDSYKSFKDIIDSVELDVYSKDINLDNIGINKEYKRFKNNNIFNIIPTNSIMIDKKNIIINKDIIKETKFSKEQNKLIDKSIKDNIEYGLKLHEQFELDDFNNPKSDIVKKFLNHFDKNKLNNSNILKEYEFIYEEDGSEYHGIIDLLIEYDNYIDIIDYKLKNINDDAYINQLNGYKKYIEKLSNKEVNIYLYSILEDKLENISNEFVIN